MLLVNLPIAYYIVYARAQFLDSREIDVVDMLVENMAESTAVITPNHINIANALSVEYPKQISTFVSCQKLYGLMDFPLKLVIHLSECAAPNRLRLFFVLAVHHLRIHFKTTNISEGFHHLCVFLTFGFIVD